MAMYSTFFVGNFIWKGTIYNINISVAIQGIVPELAKLNCISSPMQKIIKEQAREWFVEKKNNNSEPLEFECMEN